MTTLSSAVYVTDTLADVRMIEGLAERLDLTLLAPEHRDRRLTTWFDPAIADRVDIETIPGGRAAFLWKAARWLAHEGADHDVVFVLDNLTAALAANLGHRWGGPPVVLQVGRPTVEYVRWGALEAGRWAGALKVLTARALVRFNERHAAGIGAVSEYVGEQCRRHNPNVDAIPFYGVDTETFAPRWSKGEARRRLGMPTDRPVVLYRSRLAPEKDPRMYLRVVDRLRADGRELTAAYMGGEHEQFSRIANEEGVEVFAGDARNRDELPVWYVAADICVQTSKSEGLALSPIEGLACEVPAVVTAVGGLPEAVGHGRGGVLVSPGDVDGMAQAVGELLDDPERAAELGREGRRWAIEHFGRERAFEGWISLAERSVEFDRGNAPVPGDLPVRVLFVDHETRLSGGQRDLVDLVRALDRERAEVHVALPAEGPLAEALRSHGARVHLVPMDENLRSVSRWELARRPWTAARHLRPLWAASRGLRRLAEEIRPDVIHTNSMKSHFAAVPAARAVDAPLVWHVRDILEAGRIAQAFVAAGARLPDRIISLSHAAAAPFTDSRAIEKVRVVHNGIRPSPVDDSEVAAWRSKLGAGADDEVLVGIVGQIAHWKGQDVFIEAAARAARRHPGARFAVVGSCLFPDNEGEFERAVRRRVSELELDDRVAWTGQVEPIEPVMAAFDVLVHASRLPEPFGRVLVEAMAQGTSVVTPSIGAGPEIVGEDVGRLVDPDNPSALADALDELLGDADLRDRLGRAARRTSEQFDIDMTAAGVLAVYDELLRGGRVSGRLRPLTPGS